MEGKLQTSFIPKQPLVENKVKKTSSSTSIFSVIGWFIFLVAVAASLGVFAYEKYLAQSIVTKNADLKKRMESFPVDSVDHFVQLDSRLKAANTLLNSHKAISKLLSLVADNTVQSVQFTNLQYSYDDSGKLSLALGGKAPNFASVALQSDTFSAQTYLHDQVFSNLGLDVDGGVMFKFSALVDQAIVQYKGAN